MSFALLRHDEFMTIVSNLESDDVIRFCQASKINRQLCDNHRIWDMLLVRDYDMKMVYRDPRDIYIKLTRYWHHIREFIRTKLIDEVITAFEAIMNYNISEYNDAMALKSENDPSIVWKDYKIAYIGWGTGSYKLYEVNWKRANDDIVSFDSVKQTIDTLVRSGTDFTFYANTNGTNHDIDESITELSDVYHPSSYDIEPNRYVQHHSSLMFEEYKDTLESEVSIHR